MTYDELQKAQEKADSIHVLQNIVRTLDANVKKWKPEKWWEDKKPVMRLGNFLRWRNGKETEVPKALFFDAGKSHSCLDIELNYDLLKLLLDYYQKQLEKEKQEFADMGGGAKEAAECPK